MKEEVTRLLKICRDNGICSSCGLPWEHHMDEPFASCGCGTSEWYDFDTTYMKLQKEIYELQEEFDKVIEFMDNQGIDYADIGE